MSFLVVDVETTIANKGHPFTPSNKLCLVGVRNEILEETFSIEYGNEPYGSKLDRIRELISAADYLVGFNIKYDLHWLRRYGIDVSACRVFDTQLAYFIATNQKNGYPSLNEACDAYGLGKKHSAVEDEYWSKGIDTCEVPWELLDEYNRQDLWLTEQAHNAQIEYFAEHPKQYQLFQLQCQDLLVLEEMEWNGLLYDTKKSKERGAEVDDRIADIVKRLDRLVDGIPVNWNSPEHVSAILYGGVIKQAVKEPFYFTYKDPKREGVWKERWITKEHTLPRLVEPLKNSALQKDGVWQTGTPILKELSGGTREAKSIITSLLELSDLSKKNDYYKGIPKLIEEMGWEDNIVHGNLNQCSAITGRLSSNKPNLQNMPEDVHEFIKSRFV